MAVRIRKTGTVTAQFASAQAIDITHLNDSVNVGDGTNLFGPLQNVGGVLCFPVYIKGTSLSAGDASASNQTSGAQKTQIVDDTGTNTIDATNVGGNYALKVDVVSTVGGGAAPAFTDDAAFTVGSTQCTPIGGLCDEVATDSVDEGDVGAVRMTADRMLYVKLGAIQSSLSNSNPIPVSDAGGLLSIDDGSGSITVDNGGTFAVQDSQVVADNAGFTDGTTKVFMGGYIYDEVAGTALTENDAAAARINVNRAQVQAIEDGATRGRYATVTASNALKVDASAVAVPVTDNSSSLTVDNAGTFAVQDSEKVADNGGFTDGTTKVLPAGYIFDEVAGTALTENDVGAARMDSKRALVFTIEDETTRGRRATVTASKELLVSVNNASLTVAQSTASSLKCEPAGGVAHDGGDSGNPIKIGFKALDSKPTAVAAADRSDAYCTLDGRLLATAAPAGNIGYQTTTITVNTETTIVTAAASKHRDIMLLILTNSSATDSVATLKDSTTGTTRATFLVPKGGGIVIPAQMCPLYQLAAVNNNWTITMSAAVSTIQVTAMYMERD